jgi:hypothetical protein
MGSGVSTASALPERLTAAQIKDLTGGKMNPSAFDGMKGVDGTISKDQFLSVVNSNIDRKLEEVYLAYSPLGEMDSKTFMKLMRDCDLVDNKSFTAGDVDLVFQKAKSIAPGASGKSISYISFTTSCIPSVCQKKALELTSLKMIICRRDGPSLTGTTKTASKVFGSSQRVIRATTDETIDTRRSSCEIVSNEFIIEKSPSSDEALAKPTLKRRGSKELLGDNPLPTTLPVSNYAGAHAIHPMFLKYCPGGEMDSRTFIKMMKDTKIIDGKLFTTTDADLIFQRSKSRSNLPGIGGTKIVFDVFVSMCLVSVAEKLRMKTEGVVDMLKQSEGPIYNGTKADDTTYTGTKAHGGIERLGSTTDISSPGVGARKASVSGRAVRGRGGSVSGRTANAGGAEGTSGSAGVSADAGLGKGSRRSSTQTSGKTGAKKGSTLMYVKPIRHTHAI